MSSYNECGCGCGTECKGRYAPGHDAKHKSYLSKLTKGSDPDKAEWAVREMVELGWGGWVHPEVLDRVPQRNDSGKRTSHRDLVDMWFVDQAGVKHTSRKCEARDREIERFTIGRPYGWDLCIWCTHTESYREEWEKGAMRKARAKEASRQVARLLPQVTEAKTWRVEPEFAGEIVEKTLHPGRRLTEERVGTITARGLHRPPSVLV